MDIQKIADFIIKLGTMKTGSCNYHIEFETVENEFKIKLNEELIESILDELSSDERVSYADIDEDSFDLNFFADYCCCLDDEVIEDLYGIEREKVSLTGQDMHLIAKLIDESNEKYPALEYVANLFKKLVE